MLFKIKKSGINFLYEENGAHVYLWQQSLNLADKLNCYKRLSSFLFED